MSEFRMSSVGACIRALAAARLGYEPIPDSESSIIVMRESSRHEDMVVEDLRAEGYEIERGGICPICPDERKGIHIELDSLVHLTGHLDGRITVNGEAYPLEIKALGRFIFDKFKRFGFRDFLGYASQIVVYMEAEKKPAFYVVKSRDTGEQLRFSVPYKGAAIPNMRVIEAPVDLDTIMTNLALCEIAVQEGVLPECSITPNQWCGFRYLHAGFEKPEVIPDVSTAELEEAAALYREGLSLRNMGEDRLEHAKQVLTDYAKKTPKYKVGGVSVSYRGERTKDFISEDELKKLLTPEQLAQVHKQSKPYADITIRVVKED